jgi:hypothetical protein
MSAAGDDLLQFGFGGGRRAAGLRPADAGGVTCGTPRFQLAATGMPTSRRTRFARSAMNPTLLKGGSVISSVLKPRLRSARSSPCSFIQPMAVTASSN